MSAAGGPFQLADHFIWPDSSSSITWTGRKLMSGLAQSSIIWAAVSDGPLASWWRAKNFSMLLAGV